MGSTTGTLVPLTRPPNLKDQETAFETTPYVSLFKSCRRACAGCSKYWKRKHQDRPVLSKLRRSGWLQAKPETKRIAYGQASGFSIRHFVKPRHFPRYRVRHFSGSGKRLRSLTVLSVMRPRIASQPGQVEPFFAAAAS